LRDICQVLVVRAEADHVDAVHERRLAGREVGLAGAAVDLAAVDDQDVAAEAVVAGVAAGR